MASVRRIALIAVLVCSLSLTGCVGLLGDDGSGDQVNPDEYDAAELQANAAASMTDAESYSFADEQEFDVEERQQGETTSLTVTVSASGTADESAAAIRMDKQTQLRADQGRLSIGGIVYVEGDTVHLEETDGNWSERTMDGPWFAAEQEAALLDGASVEIVGTDTVEGHETVVLEVDASEEAVSNYGLDSNMAADSRPGDGTLESADVTLYVGAEAPHYVYRTEIETTVTSENPTTTVDATFTRTYDDFGDDLDVERPEGLDR